MRDVVAQKVGLSAGNNPPFATDDRDSANIASFQGKTHNGWRDYKDVPALSRESDRAIFAGRFRGVYNDAKWLWPRALD
jgi:hypothetical protein